MRELKFRAWEKDSKRWVSRNIGIDCGGMRYWIFGLNASPVDRGDYDIEQFTGLLDKNGREIYEGDIVKDDGGTEGNIAYKGVITFGSYGMMLAGFYSDTSVFGTPNKLMISEGVEVIGNRWENPEILKEGRE